MLRTAPSTRLATRAGLLLTGALVTATLLASGRARAQEGGPTVPVEVAPADAAPPPVDPRGAVVDLDEASDEAEAIAEEAEPEPPDPGRTLQRATLDPPDPDDVDEAEVDDETGERERSEDVVERLGEAMGELGQQLGPGAGRHQRLRWDPSWPRYRFDELVLTLGMLLVIGLEEILPTRTDPNWVGTTDLDLEVARAFGVSDPTTRDVLDEVSSGLAIAAGLWPIAIDSLLYAGLGEGAWDVAWQLSLVSLEVLAINHAVGVLVRLLTRRERPLGRFCRQEAGYDSDPVCRDQPPAESFWSSQVSNAFAGAALVCLHHDVVDLFGDAAADGVACGSALALAATTGVMRLMSDQNWATDVLTGAVVGTLSGLLIPWLLHFQGGARPPLRGSEAPLITFFPMVGDDVMGISSSGVF